MFARLTIIQVKKERIDEGLLNKAITKFDLT